MKVPIFSHEANCRQIKTKCIPPPLYNHATLSTPSTIIMYAGQRGCSYDFDTNSNRQALTLLSDTIWIYTLESESFERVWVDTYSKEPPVRMDCALAWLEPNEFIGATQLNSDSKNLEAPYSRMIMYGGWGLEHGLDDDDLSDIWIFNFNTNIWTQIRPKQDIAMSGHKIFVSKGEMYAFKPEYDVNHELPVYILNLKTLNWRTMKLSDSSIAPSARESFLGAISIDAMQNKLQGNSLKYGWLMIGGNSERYGTLNDVHKMIRKSKGIEWEEKVCSGEYPSPRTGSQMVWLCGRWVFLFGGDIAHDTEIDIDVSDNSVYLLDLKTNIWRKMKINGTMPKGCAGHSMNILFHPQQQLWKIVIIGGKLSSDKITDNIFEITLTHEFGDDEVETFEELYEDSQVQDFLPIQEDSIVKRAKEIMLRSQYESRFSFEMKFQQKSEDKKNPSTHENENLKKNSHIQDTDLIMSKISTEADILKDSSNDLLLPTLEVGTKSAVSPSASISCMIL